MFVFVSTVVGGAVLGYLADTALGGESGGFLNLSMPRCYKACLQTTGEATLPSLVVCGVTIDTGGSR